MENRMITASFTELHEQGLALAGEAMRRGSDEIDRIFGDGYAAKHPEVLVAFMRVASSETRTGDSLKVFESVMLELAEAVHRIAESIG